MRSSLGSLGRALRGAFSRAASSSTASSSSSSSVASAAPPASSYRFHPEHFPEVPPVPLALGLAGAIPFVALAAPVSASIGLEGVFPEAYRAAAQAGYGAAILSFLGGTQWGFAASGYGAAHVAAGSGKVAADAAFAIANLANLAGPGRYVYGVAPSLYAWAALALPVPAQLVALAGGLGAVLAGDAHLASKGLMPRWLMPLRFVLTGTAVISLLSSVPAAYERQKAEDWEKTMVSKLKSRAPKTDEALRKSTEDLAETTGSLRDAKRAAEAAAKRVAELEAAAGAREAELAMTRGAKEAAAEVARARVEAVTAEAAAARAELQTAKMKLVNAEAEAVSLRKRLLEAEATLRGKGIMEEVERRIGKDE